MKKLMFIMMLLAVMLVMTGSKSPTGMKNSSQSVWYVDQVVYTLMRCNGLYYTLTLRYTEYCWVFPGTWEGYTIWQHTIDYKEDPLCDPTMWIYPSAYNPYVTFDAAIVVVYRNRYGGVYYDQEIHTCELAPFTITNPIEYPL